MKKNNLIKMLGFLMGMAIMVSGMDTFPVYADSASTEETEAGAVTEKEDEDPETEVAESPETNKDESAEIETETMESEESLFEIDKSGTSAGAVILDEEDAALSGFSRCRVELKFVSTEGEPVPDVQVAVYKVQNGGITQNSAAMTDEVRKYYTQAEKEAVEEGKITATKGTVDYMEQVYDYLTGLHSSIKPEQILVSDYQGRCSITMDVSDKGTDDAVYFIKQAGASQDAVLYNNFSSFLVSVPERNDGVIRSLSEFTVTMLEPGEYLMVEAAQNGDLLVDDSVEEETVEETEKVPEEMVVEERGAEPVPEETAVADKTAEINQARSEIVISVPVILVFILALVVVAGFSYIYSAKKQNPDKTLSEIFKVKSKKEDRHNNKEW